MEYKLYKLKFKTGVHFGNGLLNDSSYIVKADTIFSAMCIEALKFDKIDELYDMVNTNRLLISDTMPYIKLNENRDIFLVPKPMLYIESDKKSYYTEKKKIKNMKYIPIKNLDDYINEDINKIDEKTQNIGYFDGVTKASVRSLDNKEKKEKNNDKEDKNQDEENNTIPYHVGIFNYNNDVGLYMIVCHENEEINIFVKNLMENISYVGIGGKRTSGLGKFELEVVDMPDEFKERIYCNENRDKFKKYMSLSVSLPKEEEIEKTLKNASYLLEKRSGFIYSTTYSNEFRRKKDLYVFSSGSCFENLFDGGIYNVAEELNTHNVYRYAKPLFLGVQRNE